MSSIARCSSVDYEFLTKTLTLREMPSESAEIEGRLLTDDEITVWLISTFNVDEGRRIFNIYKGIEPRPLMWEKTELRPANPYRYSWSDSPLYFSGEKKGEKVKKLFFLQVLKFIENRQGEIVAVLCKKSLTKNQFCDQPWVGKHKKKCIQDHDEELIYQHSKRGYTVHLFSPRVKHSDKKPPTGLKRLLIHILDLIQHIFHKCSVFSKKMARKIFNIKRQFCDEPWVEEHKKKWVQNDGELLIYRPDKPLKCCVHLLNPMTTKRITFKRQANVEQEDYLAI
ncbi:MAG TPA: hypothetical protein VIJ14_05770 [Rhabdochlamydiaceae bacterium]